MIKKICIFAPFYSFAGRSMITYYEKIFPLNVEMFLFCKETDKERFNLKRTKIVTHTSGKIGVTKVLRKFCKDNQIDVLTNLSRREKVAMLMIYSTIFTKTKSLFYDHGNPKSKNILVLFLLQFFLDRILVTTTDIESKLKKFLFFSKNKIFFLSPSVNTDFFIPKNKEKIRRKLKLGSKEKVIIYSGRISYMKGSDFLWELTQKNPSIKFILAGNILDERFKKELSPNVLLTGPISPSKLGDYYSASDLCIFLSRSEGAGLVPREAMSCGTPAIISNIESLRTLKIATQVPLEIVQIQNSIDSFFTKSKKELKDLSEKSRNYIVSSLSDKALKEDHIRQFLFF